MSIAITKEEYFRELTILFVSGNGVFEDSENNELWFDVANINGKDLRMCINQLNNELKNDGLISHVEIYGMGEGHLWFTDKGMSKIKRIKDNLNNRL